MIKAFSKLVFGFAFQELIKLGIRKKHMSLITEKAHGK